MAESIAPIRKIPKRDDRAKADSVVIMGIFEMGSRTRLKNPHRRECTAKDGIARRKAQGIVEAMFKRSNEARVPFALHPKGGALLPRLVVASS